VSGDGGYRYLNDEEEKLYDGFWQVAQGHSGDTVTAACLCFLADVWKTRPLDVVSSTEDFLGVCMAMLSRNVEIPPPGKGH
jgi:hypothetical protein